MTSTSLASNRERALLALVVAEARKTVGMKHNSLGRTALQKLVYFLKVRGVPMNYKFDVHYYGPFCQEILSDTEWLKAYEVIDDRSQDPKRSDYIPSHRMDEVFQAHQAYVEAHKATVQEVVSRLAPLSIDELELMSTLDFAHRSRRAEGGTGPWKDAVIQRFQEWKGGKFDPERVGRAYDLMVESGVFKE